MVLLGQNVNGYHDTSSASAALFPQSAPYDSKVTPGFSNLYRSKHRDSPGPRFEDLLEAVSEINPGILFLLVSFTFKYISFRDANPLHLSSSQGKFSSQILAG